MARRTSLARAMADQEQQQLLPGIPPRERTPVEGNIVEHPIWKLTNREARPMRPMVDRSTGKILIDPATGKPQRYADPADYRFEVDLGEVPGDARKRRKLNVEASVHHGYPTLYAFRVLVVVIEKAHQQKYAAQKVEITPTEIATGLGIEEPGGSAYRAIYDALNALEGVQLAYVDTYYDVALKKVTPGRRTERLVKKSVFKATRAGNSPPPQNLTLVGMDGPSEVEPALLDEPENFVELGDGIWSSLTGGYRFPVDREFLNELPNEMTQRLYAYLAKKDGRGAEYEEFVVKLGARLGLAKTAPSQICEALGPALEVLGRPCGRHGKVFLNSYKFVGERRERKLVVTTNREADQDEAAARASEVVRTLKERFGNPAR